MDDLVARWVALAGEETRRIGADLADRYGEEHRRYHTREHLVAVLDLVDELAGHADDPDLVRLAAWFHDAVYDPRRGDNEERSAVKAERVLADTDLPPEAIAEVARLVRLTATHTPGPADRNGQVLCDADLAILGADAERYAAYAAAVRSEYAFVPEEHFNAARADILRSLLAKPTIFHTPPARERFERRARRNLHQELSRLESALGR
ncbi:MULTISPECIES: HD domain-containing protein [Thermomonospora]|uniref:Metal dependent phosphohydrolase n=1 Tax=Thermomonospora curvata (strain ATCC 19995 / DSM 43183 / JCM 3096 / KCTC 9072 / NBRC 15933 / NCIMB 10081 / Henssen B9) TaxID=471852 RepID=D1ACM1_THECD|nr:MULTISPECIES: HD domain-containing protein [Thermomonospora]ACY99280.1 metal dependent phosphohydrolase [Thermomonospora curvata DSM 43183]PKK12339.1 MAG: HD domain-containing protein [Thermomonospora sp. CIF 1]